VRGNALAFCLDLDHSPRSALLLFSTDTKGPTAERAASETRKDEIRSIDDETEFGMEEERPLGTLKLRRIPPRGIAHGFCIFLLTRMRRLEKLKR